MPSFANEKESMGLGLQEEGNNSQEAQKSKYLGNKHLPWETNGKREECKQAGITKFSPHDYI